MHTVFALLCFVVVIHWLIFPYPSGLLHWHCGNLTIGPVPAKQPWWIWINTSCEFIMNDCITTTKQSTTKPCAYFLGYTVALFSYRFMGIEAQQMEHQQVFTAIIIIIMRFSISHMWPDLFCLVWGSQGQIHVSNLKWSESIIFHINTEHNWYIKIFF